MARNRQTAWRVEGYRQEIRDHGGLLPEARGQEGTAFPDRRAFGDGRLVAVRGQAHAPQAAPYRQTRVRQACRGGGLRGLVLVGAALREEVARGASVRRRRLSRARLERRGHAGRFRRGRRHDRRGRRQGALPGRHVPALEHAVRGRDAGRERGMRVRGAGPDLRPHRHGSPRAGARQRHRCGLPRRVEQGGSGARVRHVLRPLPARDEVPRPRIPATRRDPSRTRSASCAAASWSPSPTRRATGRRRGISCWGAARSRTWATTVPAGRYASCSTGTAGRCSRCRARFDAVEWVSARPTRRATSRSARSVTSRARHGAAGRCSRGCARSRWRSAPPTAGT